jgi:hypothetical protein
MANRWDTGRTEAFSDVLAFGIPVTLRSIFRIHHRRQLDLVDVRPVRDEGHGARVAQRIEGEAIAERPREAG